MRAVEHLRHLANDGCSRRVRELGELLEMFAQLLACTRRFDRGTHEDRTLGGRMEID